jgi:DNA invertase Pin-like site-specific DNA recombinase
MNEIKKKLTVIWARVSGKDQTTISPISQVSKATDLLSSKGKTVELVLKPADDWKSSAELYDCPEWLQLVGMIQRGEVGTLCCLDRDRLESEPLDRQIFMAMCKDNGVEVLFCLGSEVIDGDMGDLIEHVYGIVKHLAVVAIRTRVPIGLNTKVTKLGKPTSYHPIYGYDWDKKTDTLNPNENYQNRKLIVELALANNSLRKIKKILYIKGILPPNYGKPKKKGGTYDNPYWVLDTIHNISTDPINEGKYAALKCKNIRKNYKEHAKCKRSKEANWYFMPNIKIIDPICTHEQRQTIIDQLPKHKQFSKRNAKEPYLFSGMIFGDDGHVYNGRKVGNIVRYCNYKQSHSLHGNNISDAVKTKVREIFSHTDEQFYKGLVSLDAVNKPQLEAELSQKEKKREGIINTQATLIINPHGFSAEAIDKAKLKLDTDLHMIDKGIADLKSQIADADAVAERVSSFLVIKERFTDVLQSDDVGRWRELLIALDCRIVVKKRVESPSRYTSTINKLNAAGLTESAKSLKWLLSRSDDNPKDWQYLDDRVIDEETAEVVNHSRRFTSNLDVEQKGKDKYQVVMLLRGGRKVPSETMAAIVNPSIVSDGIKCVISAALTLQAGS